MIHSRIIQQGGRNLVLQVDGYLEDQANSWELILDATELKPECKFIRLDGASWLIQEKGTILLWWDKDNLIFPMESRNKADFYHPLDCPKGEWSHKLYMSWMNCPTPKYFMFQLNMDKQL